jgi:hypothetical protein
MDSLWRLIVRLQVSLRVHDGALAVAPDIVDLSVLAVCAMASVVTRLGSFLVDHQPRILLLPTCRGLVTNGNLGSLGLFGQFESGLEDHPRRHP